MTKPRVEARKTQLQRKEETQQAILTSARKIFGKKGYSGTALDEIAKVAGVTEGPVYHYFKNKKQLFWTLTEIMEGEFAEDISSLDFSSGETSLLQIWDLFLQYCQNPEFVQVVLIDSPHVLGRERWKDTRVIKSVWDVLNSSGFLAHESIDQAEKELVIRMIMAAMAEVAMEIAKNPKYNDRHILKNLMVLFVGANK